MGNCTQLHRTTGSLSLQFLKFLMTPLTTALLVFGAAGVSSAKRYVETCHTVCGPPCRSAGTRLWGAVSTMRPGPVHFTATIVPGTIPLQHPNLPDVSAGPC